MKAKHAVIIFGIGLCLYIIGALFKIMHWPFAGIIGIIMTVASILELIGIVLFFYKLFTYPKFKEFLNW